MRFIVFPKSFFSLPFLFRRLIILCFLTVVSGAAANADVGQASTEDSRRLYKQAQKLSKKRQFAEAETLFRRAMEINPQSSEAKIELAHLLNKQRRLIEAYKLAVEVARSEPKNARAFAVLGSTMLAAGNFQEAKTVVYNDDPTTIH